jgi:ribonucleotide reductase beta subunit family protein with ferritin-like domain
MAALFPITRPHLWEHYKKAVGSFWTVEEIDLAKDLDDWRVMTPDEKHFIKMVLAFFAGADGIVFDNLNLNFAAETDWNEAKAFYAYQGFNEMIHAETYSLLIDKYAESDAERDFLFNAVSNVPTVGRKAEWARKWFSRDLPLEQRLIAFACVEGIFFSGAFCAIFWLKKRGVMPGLCFSNELISRDEGSHLDFAVAMVGELRPGGEGRYREIVAEAVEIEKEFILEALPCKLIGMDSAKMSEYIEYVADRLLKSLGQPVIFGTANPFDWMEKISLEGKTNFFEKRVGDYSKHTGGDIRFNEDF